jgi:hypothetical protein
VLEGIWQTGVRIAMRLNTSPTGAYNLHGIQNQTRAIVLSGIQCKVFRGENFHQIGEPFIGSSGETGNLDKDSENAPVSLLN